VNGSKTMVFDTCQSVCTHKTCKLPLGLADSKATIIFDDERFSERLHHKARARKRPNQRNGDVAHDA